MRFGQLAGDAQLARAKHGMGYGQRVPQPVLTFKEDQRQCEIGEGGQRLFLIRPAAGQEPQKREGLRSNTASREGRHGRARTGYDGNRDTLPAAGADQPVTGIGHQRQPGIGDESQRLPFVQKGKDLGELVLLVMVVKAEKTSSLHPAALAEQPGPAGILGKDHGRAFEHLAGAGGKITRVAKRRRHYP